MQALAGFASLLLVMAAGLITIIRPLRIAGLTTRKRGAAVLGGGFLALSVLVAVGPPPTGRPAPSPSAPPAVTPAAAVTPPPAVTPAAVVTPPPAVAPAPPPQLDPQQPIAAPAPAAPPATVPPVERRAGDRLADDAEAACAAVQQIINQLVDFSFTRCFTSAGTRPRTVSLILVTEQPLLAIPDAKKAWLLACVGIVGNEANRRPRLAVDKILFTDLASLQDGMAYAVEASVITRLQAAMTRNTVTLDQAYERLTAALQPEPFRQH